MENYNKTIDLLEVKYIKSRRLDIVRPVYIQNYFDLENTLIYLYEGEIKFEIDGNETTVKEGEMLFLPSGYPVTLIYGSGDSPRKVGNREFLTSREEFLQLYVPTPGLSSKSENFAYMNFSANVFENSSFFNALDIPPFTFKSEKILELLRESLVENQKPGAGQTRILNLLADRITVEIIRYILKSRMFVEKLATNSSYFQDPRLITIFTHIRKDLSADLSNKVLAKVAAVSDEYIGQYFKQVTGISPQDYIEYLRMEQAVKLLRTSGGSIREIGAEVGYKDTAYFCRRFKTVFGIPAGKMRRRDARNADALAADDSDEDDE